MGVPRPTGLYHGTLPTLSHAPTRLHGNHGSALVTKQRMVDGLRRQAARGETTPESWCSAHLFSGSPGRQHSSSPPAPGGPGARSGGAHERFDFELW